jgi:DNA-binding IclR family transcriptional regulator
VDDRLRRAERLVNDSDGSARAAARAGRERVEVGELARRWPWARAAGSSSSYGENHPGINGISAPLMAGDHTVLGSITIAGPAERLPEAVINRLAGPLAGACQELSPRLASILGPDPGITLEALDL